MVKIGSLYKTTYNFCVWENSDSSLLFSNLDVGEYIVILEIVKLSVYVHFVIFSSRGIVRTGDFDGISAFERRAKMISS